MNTAKDLKQPLSPLIKKTSSTHPQEDSAHLSDEALRQTLLQLKARGVDLEHSKNRFKSARFRRIVENLQTTLYVREFDLKPTLERIMLGEHHDIKQLKVPPLMDETELNTLLQTIVDSSIALTRIDLTGNQKLRRISGLPASVVEIDLSNCAHRISLLKSLPDHIQITG